MNYFARFAVLVLIIASVHPGDAAAPTCPDDDSEICYSCLAKADCTSGGEAKPSDIPCETGEACREANGETLCLPVADVPGCDCGGANADCDLYNDDLAIYCIEGDIYEKETCDADHTCAAGQCVIKPTSPTDPCSESASTDPGFLLVEPECTSAVFCDNGAQVTRVNCSAGEYFNLATSACEAYPPDPCADCTKTACPVISDCTKYAVCTSGGVFVEERQCAAGQYFNPETLSCALSSSFGDNDLDCQNYIGCDFEALALPILTPTVPTDPNAPTSTTVSTKPAQCTADNVDQRYPHETDCEKFYACREISPGSYGYVLSSCTGIYVFNPDTGYCDYPENVPDCTTA
jgi:hypothetical protein